MNLNLKLDFPKIIQTTLIREMKDIMFYMGVSGDNYGEDPPQSSTSSQDLEDRNSESVEKAIQRSTSQENENLF